MQAWLVENARAVRERPLVRRELPDPKPAAGEVTLEVLACGVCHTDLHIAEGDLPLRVAAVVPGHQIVGRVVATGEGVRDRALGDLVGVTWLAQTCGSCEFCRGGRENLCEEAAFTGYDRHGGYATATTARADYTVPLPAGSDALDNAPLLCAGVIGYRSLKLSGIRRGERLGLIGFGASAHLVLQLAQHLGAEVFVFTRGEHHRRQARGMGATWVGGLEEAHSAECHAQILFAPAGELIPRCLRHLRRGGTLAVNAVHLSDIPSLPYERLFGERVLRSVSHVTRNDAVEFLEMAASAPIRTHVTRFRFEEANEALLAIKEARIEGQAVLDVTSA